MSARLFGHILAYQSTAYYSYTYSSRCRLTKWEPSSIASSRQLLSAVGMMGW